MGFIKLKNIRTFSYHGCLVEESKIGSNYIVDLTIKTDLSQSSKTDKLEHTVDYVLLNKIVVDEMAIRSNLLEHVARRIIDRALDTVSAINYIHVSVSKLNPPIGGDVKEVSVEIERFRN
jgi:7,8-dihydroneopterin aldolase/epimerase/oxygenase